MRLLAISGSLRVASSNGAVVQAAAHVAPPGARVVVFDRVGELPAFSPDLDVEPAPAVVAAFREALREADAVLISSPEYAHGVPGALKNALDWVVGSGELMEKPVALVNTSAMSTYVTAQLTETLTVMMARVVVARALPLASRPADAATLLADRPAAEALRDVLATLAGAVQPGVA